MLFVKIEGNRSTEEPTCTISTHFEVCGIAEYNKIRQALDEGLKSRLMACIATLLDNARDVLGSNYHSILTCEKTFKGPCCLFRGMFIDYLGRSPCYTKQQL